MLQEQGIPPLDGRCWVLKSLLQHAGSCCSVLLQKLPGPAPPLCTCNGEQASLFRPLSVIRAAHAHLRQSYGDREVCSLLIASLAMARLTAAAAVEAAGHSPLQEQRQSWHLLHTHPGPLNLSGPLWSHPAPAQDIAAKHTRKLHATCVA